MGIAGIPPIKAPPPREIPDPVGDSFLYMLTQPKTALVLFLIALAIWLLGK